MVTSWRAGSVSAVPGVTLTQPMVPDSASVFDVIWPVTELKVATQSDCTVLSWVSLRSARDCTVGSFSSTGTVITMSSPATT